MGHKSKFMQITFSILSPFYSIKQINFTSFHFFIPPTKYTERKIKIFFIPLLFHFFLIFYSLTFLPLQKKNVG